MIDINIIENVINENSNIAQWLSILITLLAVIVALFQEKIKQYFNKPDFDINIDDKKGEKTIGYDEKGNELNLTYYHIFVINNKPKIKIENCKIQIIEIVKIINDVKSNEKITWLPYLFWAPREKNKTEIDIYYRDIADIGYYDHKKKTFNLSVDRYPNYKNHLFQISSGESLKVKFVFTARNTDRRLFEHTFTL